MVRCTRWLTRSHQPSNCVLEVEVVREPPARLEVGAHEPVRALKDPLRLRIRRLQDHPADPQLPAERRELARSGDRRRRGSRPPDPTPASPATPRSDSRQRPRPHRMSGASLEKTSAPATTRDQHSSAGHHIPAAPLPVTDRDQLPGLPQIALHQLARPIDRPLKRAPHHKPRPDLPDIVIEDRLAAHIPQLGRHLPQPQRLDRTGQPAAARRSTPETDRASTPPAAAHTSAATLDTTARATVSRAIPSDFATCRCERRSTSTNRRISAHCSTPTTHSSSPDPHGSDERQQPAGQHPTPRQVA